MKNLRQESRYLAFIDQKAKPKDTGLQYLLPNISAAKLKTVNNILKPAPKEN